MDSRRKAFSTRPSEPVINGRVSPPPVEPPLKAKLLGVVSLSSIAKQGTLDLLPCRAFKIITNAGAWSGFQEPFQYRPERPYHPCHPHPRLQDGAQPDTHIQFHPHHTGQCKTLLFSYRHPWNADCALGACVPVNNVNDHEISRHRQQ